MLRWATPLAVLGYLGSLVLLATSGGVESRAARAAAGESKTRGNFVPAAADTLALAYPDDPDTLNALIASDTVSEAFHRWVYEPLANAKFANPDELEPALAERWEFDEERLEYTIHLRKGVKWHPLTLPNGTPLPEKEFTARDVKFSFDCVLNPNAETTALRSYFEDPEAADADQRYKIKVSVVDNYTLKVRWTRPYFLMDEWTLAAVPIIPRHVYSVDENGEPISLDFSSEEFAQGFNTHWANNKMCGTGPMRYVDWRRDDRLVLERNDAYWGAPFFFSRVVFSCERNPLTLLNKALSRELDWTAISQKDQFLQIASDANVTSGRVLRKEYDYPGYRYIGYNLRRPFLNERDVRHALSSCVPIDDIIREVFKGLARPLTGPFQPGTPAYNPSVPRVAYDLKKAAELLDRAGWKDTDQDGVRDKLIDGRPVPARFKLMIYGDAPQYLAAAQLIQANCRKVGVDVVIDPAKWALMLDRLRTKDFDAAMLGWALSWRPDPFQIWHSSQAEAPDSSNAIGFQNPEVDRLIEELRRTRDRDAQVPLYHEIHRLIAEDQPYTFLLVDLGTGVLNSRIENVVFYKPRPCYDAREWGAVTPR